MVVGLRNFTERVGDGAGEPVLDANNGEELMHVQPSVAIVLGNHPPDSPGTLFISSKQVIWLSDVDRDKGYAVDFLSVSLHAVSRDPEAYPSPCIYTQIETGEDEVDSEGSDSECDGPLDLSKITEMRLVPSDPTQLDTLFDIFCGCAELNPEPNQEGEEDSWDFPPVEMGYVPTVEDNPGWEFADNPGWYFADNPSHPIGHSNGHHDLAQPMLELQISDERFEDAEEMEHQSGHDRK